MAGRRSRELAAQIMARYPVEPLREGDRVQPNVEGTIDVDGRPLVGVLFRQHRMRGGRIGFDVQWDNGDFDKGWPASGLRKVSP